MRSPIGLADLLRAWDAAGRDPRLLGPLAGALGLGASPPPAPDPRHVAERRPSPRFDPVPQPERAERPRTLDSRLDERGPHDGVSLRAQPSRPPSPPAWSISPPLARPERGPVALPPPLFRPERERALLAAVARRLRPDGEVDVQGLVPALARLDLPRRLPRLHVPSLRGGAQLLVDRSEWMMPFDADTRRLVDRFRSVVGEACEELWVSELPPEVTRPTDGSTRRWTAPAAGTALVIVSDLGRTALQQRRRHPRAAWLEFIHQVDAAGFEPILMVPGRRASYVEADRALPNTLLLGWDRAARVAEVARSRRRLSR